MLELAGLTKRYQTGDLALRDVTLSVPEGQVVGLIGPSGSGKSTLIRCINRLVEPTAGSVRLRGRLETPHHRGRPCSAKASPSSVGGGSLHFRDDPPVTDRKPSLRQQRCQCLSKPLPWIHHRLFGSLVRNDPRDEHPPSLIRPLRPLQIEAFQRWGYPLWFIHLIGSIEVAGGVALLFRRVSALAAAGLALMMVGAVMTPVLHPEWVMLAAPGVILALSA